MKVMLDKPITIPATTATKTENDDLSFLDFMPPENSPPTNDTTDSTKEMLPDVLEENTYDIEQQDVAYAENAREVSDLLFQFLQKETAKGEPLLDQNKTIALPLHNDAVAPNVQMQTVENNAVKQTLKQETITTTNDVYLSPQNNMINTKKNTDIKINPAKTPETQPLPTHALTPDDAFLTVNKNNKIKQVAELVTQSDSEASPLIHKKTVVTNKPVTIELAASVSKAKLQSNEQMLVTSSVEVLNAMPLIDNKTHKTELPPNIVLTVEAKAVKEPHEANVVINQHHIRISVNPPELGPVSATIRYDQNRMVLDIAVKNTDIGEMIKQHLPEMRQQLGSLNLNIDNINVQNMDNLEKDNGRGSHQARDEMDEFAPMASKAAEKRSESTKNKQNTLVDTYI